MPTVIFLTGSGNWTVPSDWNSAANTIECVGAGQSTGTGPAAGGHGGAYSKISNLALTPGASIPYAAPTGGSSTDTSFNTSSCIAQAGANGGLASGCTGTTKYSGGAGSATYMGTAGGSGGGAAGPNGAGSAGNTGGAGGSADAGSGGAGGVWAGGYGPGQPGGAGTEWDSTHGCGGGASGGGSGAGPQAGGAGGNYGGGASGPSNGSSTVGVGGAGLIVITYTPVVAVARTSDFMSFF